VTTKRQPVAAAAFTLVAGIFGVTTSAQALDWSGYFRAGPGATKKGSARNCYGLAGVPDGVKFRLGNECDFYGEFALSQPFKSGGLEYKATLMTDLYNGATDSGSSKFGAAQMFAEAKGFDVAPNTNFWIGKRYYARSDVHIVDTHFINLSGVGAGADEIKLGNGQLGIAYFRVDDTVADVTGNQPANRFNVDYSDIDVNPGGKLRAVFTFTQGSFTNGKTGLGLSLQHRQKVAAFGSGDNTLWLQLAQGSAALDGRVGDGRAGSQTKSVRVIDSIHWQVGKFGGQALALWMNAKTVNPVTQAKSDTTTIGLGGRGSYAITHHFKMVSEIGYSQSKPKGGNVQKLAKFTLAPTLSAGPDFWNRPEFRLYVTQAKWNGAANAAAGPAGLTGSGDGKTTGTSYGAQVEMWF